MPRTPVPLLAVLSVLLVTADLAFADASWEQGGYADRTSVAPGQSIVFHIASTVSPFSLEIYNLARPAEILTTLTGLTSQARDCTGMWESGCGWPVTTTFTIPAGWPSGYYAAQFPTGLGRRFITFIVRAAAPGVTSPIVVIAPTHTWQAYNNFGGKSLYDSSSTDGQRAHVVSQLRPFTAHGGLGRYPDWESALVDWMATENRPFDLISDDDLENPEILDDYRLALLVGHSEYWTLEARQTLERFSSAGGHVAVFAGNSMWWQVRYDTSSRQITCYKSAALDPLTGVDDARVTTNFWEHPVRNPESLILGASFRNSYYANTHPDLYDYTPLPVEQREPFTVRDAGHWVFAATGLSNGGTFGRASAGTEVDGVTFNAIGSELVPDGSDGAPLDFDILATLPADQGYGTIGMYTNASGGAVFNAGTRDWTRGLPGDAAVQQITRNVLDRLGSGDPFPHEPRSTPYAAEERFNMQAPREGAIANWRRNAHEFAPLAGCAYEGPFGLAMRGAEWTQIVRNFTPTREGTTAATLSFYLNLDFLDASPSFSTPIADLVNESATETLYASIEMKFNGGAKQLRLALWQDSDTRAGTSSWLTVAAGWQPVTMVWRSGGLCELQVGSETVQITNSVTGSVNEVMLQFAGSDVGAAGYVCVDQLTVHDDDAAEPSPETSTIAASPDSIPADGSSTSTIFVQLKTASGANLTRGGAEVALQTSHGTISAVTDNDDGTYTAVLTSAATPGMATITGTLNGTPIVDAATVELLPGSGATSVVLTTSANPADPETPLTLTATVTATGDGPTPTGTITFKRDTVILGTATLDGGVASLVTTIPSGSHSLTAAYSGDSGYADRISAELTQHVRLPPSAITATPVSTSSVALTWSAVQDAVQYRVERSDGGGFAPILVVDAPATSASDANVVQRTAYLYRVIAIGANGIDGVRGSPDLATTVAFTIDPTNRIRASDINDVRAAVSLVRATAGLEPATYTRPNISTGMLISRSDIMDIRDAVNEARVALGMAPFAFTDPSLPGGTVAKRVHVRELQLALGAM